MGHVHAVDVAVLLLLWQRNATVNLLYNSKDSAKESKFRSRSRRRVRAVGRLRGSRGRKLGRNGFSSDRPRESVDPPEYLRDLREGQGYVAWLRGGKAGGVGGCM